MKVFPAGNEQPRQRQERQRKRQPGPPECPRAFVGFVTVVRGVPERGAQKTMGDPPDKTARMSGHHFREPLPFAIKECHLTKGLVLLALAAGGGVRMAAERGPLDQSVRLQ